MDSLQSKFNSSILEGAEKITGLSLDEINFANAEVIEMKFNRGNTLQCIEIGDWKNCLPPSLQVTFCIFEQERLDKFLIYIELEFVDVQELKIYTFGYQNPICSLDISESFSERLKTNMKDVSWGGAGHDVEFICSSIKFLQQWNEDEWESRK